MNSLIKKIWPELDTMNLQRRLVAMGDVLAFFSTLPFSIAGLVWLVRRTDLHLIYLQIPMLLVLAGLAYLFTRLSYFIITAIRTDRYGSAEGSLVSAIQWCGVLLFGPSALWISVISAVLSLFGNWRRFASKSVRWRILREFSTDLAISTLAYLVALLFYQSRGGTFPFPLLSTYDLLPALEAQAVYIAVVVIIWSPYTLYSIWVQRRLSTGATIKPVIKFWLLALGLPFLAIPYGIVLAGLYSQNGFVIFFFLVTGLLLVAFLARRLSWAVETSRQKTRQLEQLELLERDILNSPPDASGLSDALGQRVPSMFPAGKVAVWLHPDRLVHKYPEDWDIDRGPISAWIKEDPDARAYLAGEMLPWNHGSGGHNPVVLTSIQDVENTESIGCIYLELHSLAQPWDRRALVSLFPAVQSLAAQVASALHQAQIYRTSLEYQAAMQELEFAGRIQSSFLPNEMPSLEGWEFAVTLLPARDTSGDYFDLIPLGNGKIGILIADVADKGLGAALYMALSRTLIRTYALEFEMQPDLVFYSTNERILQDARANLFVTAFYGILDQKTGTFTYSNAGHNPPFLISYKDSGSVHALTATGMPIGVDEETYWKMETIAINPGDVLLMYTDGIPDAQNNRNEFFTERRMVEIAKKKSGTSAQEIQQELLRAIQGFVEDAPQFDDITLLVVMRDRE